MSDLLESGREQDRALRTGLPPVVRVTAIGLVVLLAGFGLSRSGLLSAEGPDRPKPPRAAGPAIIAKAGNDLVRLDSRTVRPGPRVPPDSTALVAVPLADGSDTLVGISDGRVVRVDPRRSAVVRDLGPGSNVIRPGTPGRVLVVRLGAVAELEVGSGDVTDASPFPGARLAAGWEPVGLVRSASPDGFQGEQALVMQRRVGTAEHETALAWSAGSVAEGDRPLVERLPEPGTVISASGNRIVRTAACPEAEGCPVLLTTITPERATSVAVPPPLGWTFEPPIAAGQGDGILISVSAHGSPGLAQLIPGEDRARLVEGSQQFSVESGLIVGGSGSFYFSAGRSSDRGRLRVWHPDRPAAAQRLPTSAPVPPGASLVCACER